MTSHYLEFHPAIIEKRQVSPRRASRRFRFNFECKLERIDVKQERRHSCRPILHDEWLYRHEEAQSDREAQRLFLRDAWQDFRARVFRWPTALADGQGAPNLHRSGV